MPKNRFAAALLAVLGLFAAGAAHAGLKARLDVDRAWLGPHDDVVAKVVVTNTGATNVRVPRWQMPKSQLDANLFEVSRDGRPVRYLGILAKRGAAGPKEFVTLKPGQSLRGRTELTRHYDMLDGVEMDALRSDADAVESNAITIWRDGPVGARADWDALNAPITSAASLAYTNCSSSQQSGVSSAVNAATSYSTGAKSYLNGKTWSSVGPRYTTWFGAIDSGRFDTVKSHFVAIEDAFLTKPVVVDCSCTQSYYAYVYPTQPYKIYVCNAFWSAPNTGTDSRGGTLVHEMSHFNVVAATDDWAYGQTACKKLAKRATKAIDNADSHEYFAENTPALN